MDRKSFVSLGGAYALTTAAARAQTNLTELRVSTAPEEDAVAILYAQESGIFHRLGLNVTVTAAASGSSIAAAVIGGTIDIGKSSLAGLITAHTKGIPFTLIAPAGEYNADLPTTGTATLASSQIHSARDLNGKVVSVQSLTGQMQIGTMDWIDQNGGDSSSVHFIELPPSLVLQALEAKRVDAATFANPDFAEAIATKKVRVVGWSQNSIGSHYLLAAYFTTIDFARKNSELVRRFAQGVFQGATYTNAHRAETVDLVSAFTKVKPAVVASMNRVTCGLQLDPREIQPLIDANVKYKVISARFDARDMIFTPPNA
jgi:NitT/TauT family transport system substrate-binding protein